MASSDVSLHEINQECDVKDVNLKNDSTLDKLILGVTPVSNASNITDENADESQSTTYVTIQLADGMQGSTLSQQKLQELILQLSESGKIQLKEDSKIVIDLKFGGKSNVQNIQSKLEVSNLQTSNNSSVQMQSVCNNSQRIVHLTNTGVSKPFRLDMTTSDNTQRSLASYVSSPSQIITIPSVGNHHSATNHIQSRQVQQQQPTYILVPTGQLSSGTESQVYANTPIRTGNTASAILRSSGLTLGATPMNSATGLNIGSTDRNIILVQQPVAAGGLHVGAGNAIATNSANNVTGTNFLPLRQLNNTVGNGLVSTGTNLVTSGSNRIIGSNVGVELFVNNSVNSRGGSQNQSSSVGLVAMNSVTSSANTSGTSQRESTWQQYVKQFSKLGPCPICGDKISGYHYGIFCCESCKGFFKRTVQNAKRYACHRPNSSSLCEINVASRKKCPACRFIKCVEKGMRIEAIRSDRTRGGRSMYPGSRYLRQIAARVSGRSSTGGVLPNSSSDYSSEIDASMLVRLTDQSMVSEDTEQLSCSVVGLTGAHHTLGPDGLPASEDAGGGVYLDPSILGTHDNDDEDEELNAASVRVDSGILEYGSNAVGPNIGSPFVGRQVVVGGATTDSGRRARDQLPKIIRDILLVEETIEAEPEDSLEIEANASQPITIPEGVSEDEAAVYRALLNLADQRLYRTVRWSRALPDFALLDTDDQILLIQNCWADLLCLDCCWRSLPTPTEIRLTSSKCINLEAAREMGAQDIVELMLELTQSLTRLQLDIVEYACLKVLILMHPDLNNLKAGSQVRAYQESVRRLLMEYVAKSSPDVSEKFTKLIERIPELHKTSQTARLMLADLDLSPYLSTNSLLMELLRSDIQRYVSPNTPTSTTTPSAKTVAPSSGTVDEFGQDHDHTHSVADTTTTKTSPMSNDQFMLNLTKSTRLPNQSASASVVAQPMTLEAVVVNNNNNNGSDTGDAEQSSSSPSGQLMSKFDHNEFVPSRAQTIDIAVDPQ